MKTKEQNVETLILEKMNIMTRFGGFCSSNNSLWISTLYFFIYQEQKEYRSYRNFKAPLIQEKKFKTRKGQRHAPLFFWNIVFIFLLFIQSSISLFIKTILLAVIFTFFGKSPSLTKRLIVDIEIPRRSETSWIVKRDYFLYSCVGDFNLKREMN